MDLDKQQVWALRHAAQFPTPTLPYRLLAVYPSIGHLTSLGPSFLFFFFLMQRGKLYFPYLSDTTTIWIKELREGRVFNKQ